MIGARRRLQTDRLTTDYRLLTTDYFFWEVSTLHPAIECGRGMVGIRETFQQRPHLVAVGEVPPFIGESMKSGMRHDVVEECSVGVIVSLPLARACRKEVGSGTLAQLIDLRAHIEETFVSVDEGQVERGAGGVRWGRGGIRGGGGPECLDPGTSPLLHVPIQRAKRLPGLLAGDSLAFMVDHEPLYRERSVGIE